MPRVDDYTAEALADIHGPGEHSARAARAKPAKKLTPTLQATLDAWNRKADKTLPYVSKPLVYGFSYIKPSEHSNLIRLVKGGHLKVCRINAVPPDGSEAKRKSPYGDRYYILRDSCPSEVPEGTLWGHKRRR